MSTPNELGARMDALSYLFSPAPEPGHAMARLEIITGGGTAGISIPDVIIGSAGDGQVAAVYEDAGIQWRGEGPSAQAAVLALLADRIGYRAVVTFKEDE